ncbi:MAG: hypothetical protein HY308_19300 [Gammaproteobacteria bacterium]|nr:hypothetical protein [Gammaproteobacteria bacterium]
MKRSLVYLAAGIAALSAVAALGESTSSGGKIKKCQDETGKWYYGDTAAESCAKSKVTILNDKGLKTKEIAAPPTLDELKKVEEQHAEQQQAADQVKKDELLLATYSHEEDIIYVRDRRIEQLETAIRTSEETLNSLRATMIRLETQAANEKKANSVSEHTTQTMNRTRQQINNHEVLIAQHRKEEEVVRQRTDAELKRFRELKTKPVLLQEPAKAP